MWGNIDKDFIYTLLLTGKLALATTAILIIIGLPIAYWLAHSKYRIKIIVETLISMPMNWQIQIEQASAFAPVPPMSQYAR